MNTIGNTIKKHKPKISIDERRERVKEMIKEHGNINPIAQKLLIKYPECVHIEGVPFVGTSTVKHKIIYTGPIFFKNSIRHPIYCRKKLERRLTNY